MVLGVTPFGRSGPVTPSGVGETVLPAGATAATLTAPKTGERAPARCEPHPRARPPFQRQDLPPPLAEGHAAVVLLQAATLAEVLVDHRDLVVAADRLAARHTQPRVRQGLEAF